MYLHNQHYYSFNHFISANSLQLKHMFTTEVFHMIITIFPYTQWEFFYQGSYTCEIFIRNFSYLTLIKTSRVESQQSSFSPVSLSDLFLVLVKEPSLFSVCQIFLKFPFDCLNRLLRILIFSRSDLGLYLITIKKCVISSWFPSVMEPMKNSITLPGEFYCSSMAFLCFGEKPHFPS